MKNSSHNYSWQLSTEKIAGMPGHIPVDYIWFICQRVGAPCSDIHGRSWYSVLSLQQPFDSKQSLNWRCRYLRPVVMIGQKIAAHYVIPNVPGSIWITMKFITQGVWASRRDSFCLGFKIWSMLRQNSSEQATFDFSLVNKVLTATSKMSWTPLFIHPNILQCSLF